VIDIGVNLTHPQFEGDLDEVLMRARAAGVSGMILTGTDVDSSEAALALALTAPDLWCTAGVHPHDAAGAAAGFEDELAALAHASSVCAIGETGLDFNRNFSPPDRQREVFRTQIALAARLGLPLFVHDRDSGGEVNDLLVRHADGVPGVVIHCFTGSREDLEHHLAAGFHIGITGWVCDRRRGAPLRELVPMIPAERLLVETDAPFLLPHGAVPPDPKHKRRNEPCLLGRVVEELARLRDEPAAEVAARTRANAIRLFRLGEPA
jgi:TatD DNase family protein